MILENKIKEISLQKDILLMTHLVLGYPSFEENKKAILEMANANVELIELQIPFSEPMADGPLILKANQESLKDGTTVEECLKFAQEMIKTYPQISFLFMSYSNILFANNISSMLENSKKMGIQGWIVPDLPPEEGKDYLNACKKNQIAPIFIFTPTHTLERMKTLNQFAQGMVYCVGRKGVTGLKTKFDSVLENQIQQYRKATQLPLALGFGVSSKEDIHFLREKVEIAVIGTKLIELQNEGGAKAIGQFLQTIR